MIIDTHAHYDDGQFDTDRDELLNSMHEGGIGLIVNAGSTLESWGKIRKLTDDYPFIYGAIGIHPDEVGTLTEDHISEMEQLLDLEKIVAVGEIGLDYHYDGTDEAAQKRAFCAQLELADSLGLPFIVHSRDAAADTLQILKDNRAKLSHGGVMHCFSGSPETAKEYLKLGLYISFAGPVTFKNARRLDEVAKIVPADRILAETDSPYLAPEPLRGTLNTPKNVVRVYEKLAALRGEPLEELAAQIHKNAHTLFKKLNAKG